VSASLRTSAEGHALRERERFAIPKAGDVLVQRAEALLREEPALAEEASDFTIPEDEEWDDQAFHQRRSEALGTFVGAYRHLKCEVRRLKDELRNLNDAGADLQDAMEKLLKDNRELEGDVAYWRELAKEREDMNSRRTSIDSPLQPSSAVLPESDDAQEVLREDMHEDAQDDGHQVRILDDTLVEEHEERSEENEEENQEENEEESEEAHEEEKEDQDMKITGDAPPGVDVDNCPTPTSDKFSPTQFDEWVKKVDEEQAAFDPRVFSENDRLTYQTQDEHNDQDEQDEQDEQDQQDEQHQQQQQQQEEQQEQQDEQDRHDEESGDATEAQITALVAEPEEALEAREEDDSEALQLEAEEVYTLELP
ncbi:unnamed protein product, partial [Polarella glacialis]